MASFKAEDIVIEQDLHVDIIATLQEATVLHSPRRCPYLFQCHSYNIIVNTRYIIIEGQ